MRPYSKALVALAMMSCGCQAIVMNGVEPDSKADSSAIAMYASQWSAGAPHDPGLVLLPASDPGDLMLFFASKAQSCAEPVLLAPSCQEPEIPLDPSTDFACPAELFWQTIMVVPAPLVQPGVIDVADVIYMYMARDAMLMSGPLPRCYDVCGAEVNPLIGSFGTLEIVSLDATSVSVKVDLDPRVGWPDSNGDYTASFCSPPSP
jgi:hypothetical protein